MRVTSQKKKITKLKTQSKFRCIRKCASVLLNIHSIASKSKRISRSLRASTKTAEIGTGICFDSRMMLHRHEWFPGEQESPNRIRRPLLRIESLGLIGKCIRIPARVISDQALLKVHSTDYVALVKRSAKYTKKQLYDLSGRYDGVFFNSFTWKAGALAAGAVQQIALQVANGQLQNGLALVRPPGHHAMHAEASGYCIFNNIAVAAASLIDSPPRGVVEQYPAQLSPCLLTTPLQRILIVDWDVHQGQGTQYTFYNDDRVLFISIHRYERKAFWPNLREGDFDFIGGLQGRGYNINIPLNKVGMNDSDYLAIFHTLIMPIAYEFNPELVFVSSGFDAAIGNAEGKMWLSPACYGHLVHHLRSLASGKLVIVLEGGYFIESLEQSCAHVLKALLGDALPTLNAQNPPCKSVRATLNASITALRQFWKSLNIPGVSRVCQRPDISKITTFSWPFVKKVIWPEKNPRLPINVVAYSRRLLKNECPSTLVAPKSSEILLLLPFSEAENISPDTARWRTCLSNDAYRVRFFQNDARNELQSTQTKGNGLYCNSCVFTQASTKRPPKDPSHSNNCECGRKIDSSSSSAHVVTALKHACMSMFRNEFNGTLAVMKSIQMTDLALAVSALPFSTIAALRGPSSFRQASSSMDGNLDPREAPSTSSEVNTRAALCRNINSSAETAFHEVNNYRLLIIDFYASKCPKLKQSVSSERNLSQTKLTIMGFSLSCETDSLGFSTTPITMTRISNGCTSHGNWISAPTGGCCSQKNCCHSSANLLTVLTSLVLPIGYRFKPDIVLVNARDGRWGVNGDKPTDWKIVSHLIFLVKNLGSRLMITVSPEADPSEDLLRCLIHSAPLNLFHQPSISTTASEHLQGLIRKFIAEHKRKWNCFAGTGDLPYWTDDNDKKRRVKSK